MFVMIDLNYYGALIVEARSGFFICICICIFIFFLLIGLGGFESSCNAIELCVSVFNIGDAWEVSP